MEERHETTGIDIRAHTEMAFATPIIGYDWPVQANLNTPLGDLILELERQQPGAEQRSNVGGWHSGSDFLSRPEQPVTDLKRNIRELVGPVLRNATADAPDLKLTYQIDGWANVLRNGQYHNVHNHPESIWSGVYYVVVGKPDPARPLSGDLEFIDPRGSINMVSPPGSVMDRKFRVHPHAGLMVLFPSWLQHFVHPYFGPGERITVAFNVRCTMAAPANTRIG